MDEMKKIQFKEECGAYLSTVSLNNLRAYGREVGVAQPTKKNKDALIDEIIQVLVGEIAPCKISRLGAPVKNGNIDPSVVARMEEIKKNCSLAEVPVPKVELADEIRAFRRENHYAHLQLFDPNIEKLDNEWLPVQGILRGQVCWLQDGVAVIPLGCARGVSNAYLSVALIERYRLKKGDVVSYRAKEKKGLRVVTEVLSINENAVVVGETTSCDSFEEQIACYPTHALTLFQQGKSESTVAKYTDWVLGLCKGQRALLSSAPKAGKSTFLYHVAKSALEAESNAYTFVLLVGATPELVGRYRKFMPDENLAYTTYEDDATEQVQTALCALDRAKSLVASGYEVFLIVDGLSALARAYNETEEAVGGKTLAGGIESKTMQFLKRYFGSARALEQGGALTMLCALDEETGDPADDLIFREMNAIANARIKLDVALASARTYPAVDLQNTCIQNVWEEARNGAIKTFAKNYGYERLIECINNSKDETSFIKALSDLK